MTPLLHDTRRTTPDKILPGQWQGGTADTQPAPRGVEALRYGFPDARVIPGSVERALRLARDAYAPGRRASG